MTRIFERQRIWTLERGDYIFAISQLHKYVSTRYQIRVVIGIARGGMEPGKALAALLDVPFYEIRAQANESDGIRSGSLNSVKVDRDALSAVPQTEGVLLVDDICGSGNTLVSVRSALEADTGSSKIFSATLCCNAGCVVTPDVWIWTVRDWVIFPWETIPGDLPSERLPSPLEVQVKL
jgi:hypoxanthine phosphoribosyltransferase